MSMSTSINVAEPVKAPVLNYLGSKQMLLPLIDRVMTPHVRPGAVFGDLFAGTGTVAAHYARAGCTVVANDHETYSATQCRALLQCRFTPRVAELVAELDALACRRSTGKATAPGLVALNFSPAGPMRRKFFTAANAARIDACRARIETWRRTGKLRGEAEHAFLLASLMRSCARVSNTTGTYTAFMREFLPRAVRPLRILPAHTDDDRSRSRSRMNAVLQGDAADAARARAFDVVYLDPPFNARHYASYYGFYNFLIAYDPALRVVGRTAAPAEYYRSPWGKRVTAQRSLAELVDALLPGEGRSDGGVREHVFMAYNNRGVLSRQDILKELRRLGPTVLHRQKPRRAYRSHGDVPSADSVEDWLFWTDCR